MAKLPDQKKPFAVHVRTSGSTAKMWRQRQHWIVAARCACRMAFGFAVEPDEKKISPRSVGATSAAMASTIGAGASGPARRKSDQSSNAPAGAASPIQTARRKNGNAVDNTS